MPPLRCGRTVAANLDEWSAARNEVADRRADDQRRVGFDGPVDKPLGVQLVDDARARRGDHYIGVLWQLVVHVLTGLVGRRRVQAIDFNACVGADPFDDRRAPGRMDDVVDVADEDPQRDHG